MQNIKLEYAASSALTFTSLNSLAASTTHLSGAESAAVDNTVNKYLDYLLSGKITAGAASAQVGRIDINVIGLQDDSTWPDVFDGTDSVESVTSAGVKAGICKLAASIATEAVNDRVYHFGPVSIADLFGGVLPKKFVVFITQTAHSTTVAIAASGNVITVTPVYATSA